MALGEATGEEAQLSAVVELMLDITESSVAFCWELGAGMAPLKHSTCFAMLNGIWTYQAVAYSPRNSSKINVCVQLAYKHA